MVIKRSLIISMVEMKIHECCKRTLLLSQQPPNLHSHQFNEVMFFFGLTISRSTPIHISRALSSFSTSSTSTQSSCARTASVLKALSSTIDPIMRQSVLTLGYFDSIAICDHSTPPTITVNLTIPSLFHPQLATIQTSLHSNLDLASASTNSQINVNLNCVKSTTSNEDTDAYKENDENEDPGGTGLKDISHILAVYSCKGGVGKSTVSANLAYALAATGAKVGLLDLDIYGPSLPTLVKPEDLTVRRSELGKSMVKPLVHEKVKMLSLGFVSPNSGVPGERAKRASLAEDKNDEVLEKWLQNIIMATSTTELTLFRSIRIRLAHSFRSCVTRRRLGKELPRRCRDARAHGGEGGEAAAERHGVGKIRRASARHAPGHGRRAVNCLPGGAVERR